MRYSFMSTLLFALLILTHTTSLTGNPPPPPKAKEALVKVNGTKLFTKTIGTGTPLVIVHGGPGMDHTYLLPQMAKLAGPCKLIFYDQRASGRSSVDVDTLTMTMDTFVEDLEGIRTAFKIGKMDLFGHSWGGLVAMFYAIRYPENLNSLILVTTSPASSRMRDSAFSIMSSRVTADDSAATTRLLQTEGFIKRDPKVIAEFFRLLFRGTFADRRNVDNLTLTFDSTYARRSVLAKYLQKDARLQSYDLHSRLAKVRCPTLIIGGDHDMVPPEANTMLQDAIAGSDLEILERCGHFPYIERPDVFFPIVTRFLKKAGASQAP